MKENYQIYLPYQFHLRAQSAGGDAQLSRKKMKTLFLSNMSKSRRRTSTFFPIMLYFLLPQIQILLSCQHGENCFWRCSVEKKLDTRSLDGGEKFFFGHRKICIGEKFTFYVYFEMKKSLGHISQFPIPRSTFSAPPFRGCEGPPKQRPNLWLFTLFSLLLLEKLVKNLGAGLVWRILSSRTWNEAR